MKSILRNITAGKPEKVYKSIVYTIIANLINIVPIGLSVEVVRILFNGFTGEKYLDTTRLIYISTFLFLYLIIMYFGEIPAYRRSYRDAYDVSAEGRAELSEKLRKLPLGYFSSRDPGDLVNMIMGDFSLIETGVSHLVPQLVGGLIMPIIAFIGLCFWNFPMAISMFISLPLGILVILLPYKLHNKLTKKHMKAKVDAGNRLQEYLNGIRVIKAYNLTGNKFKRLERAFNIFKKESLRLEATLGPFAMLAVSFIRIGLTLMIMLGTYLIIGDKLDIFTFVAFLIVGTRVYDPLTTALYNFLEFRYNSIAGKRIMALLEEPEMKGGEEVPINNHIELKDVSFGYNEKTVLKNINLRLKEGTMTAIVGPSGCGKTTLMKIMARFYDPNKGEVFFGGVDEKNIDNEKLMKRISFVFQDVYLFRDTIKNNIGFGKDNATDEEIIEAAKKSCAHEFIIGLPNRYDTMVGEGGSTLSGGEKQRISIARALLKEAPVIFLDEATASLDPENEIEVQRAINTLIEGRTVVVIAHKLMTIENADNIVVLDNGRIVEQGKHESLIKTGGLYSKLWTLQRNSSGWSLN